MSRTQLDAWIRIVTCLSMLFTHLLSPALTLASQPAQQGEPTVTATPMETVEPTATETVEPTATETATVPTTVEVTETAIETPLPTETPTVTVSPIEPTATETETVEETPTVTATEVTPPAETATALPTETPSPTLEASPTLTYTTGPPVPTATETATLTPTPTLTPTVTVVTPTVTVTPTATLTPTATPSMTTVALDLLMEVDPPTVAAGEQVTVTLSISNPGPGLIDNLVLSTTLPVELGYEQPLGSVAASYELQSRQLSWSLPAPIPPQTTLTLGYRARLSDTAQAGPLTLVAELVDLNNGQTTLAQASLTVILPLSPTVTPIARPHLAVTPPGSPAQVQLGVEPQTEKAAESRHWLAVAVTDADGRAVADGTEVILSIQGGKLAQDRLQTKAGMAITEFKAPPGQTVLITASAGQVQTTLQWPEPVGPGLSLSPLLKERDPGYGTAAGAIHQARHRLRQVGDNLRADNPSRWANFSRNGLNFQLKRQAAPGTRQAPAPLSLDLSLTEVRVGSQSLLPDRPQPVAGGAWVLYQSEGQPWQMVYEVGEASVEQYFVFEKGTPTEGDLVIELRLETALKPVLLSDEEGLRFEQPGGNKTEGQELAYGPVLVEDAGGRQIRAQLALQGKRLNLTIPATWLAQATFPVVVDPVIGPATLVSGLQGGINEPVVASDGTDFLSVWGWNGDLYGHRLLADGSLTGTLISLSQAEGLQSQPAVTYNPASGEYLVVWKDERDGPSYPSLRGRRLDNAGQLLDSELEILPPSYQADQPGVAAASGGAYLVTWSEPISGSSDISGQMLTSSGALSGTILTLSNASNDQKQPAVAYDPQANLFLVAWQDQRDGTLDIYGQLVQSTGVLSGSNQQLANNGTSLGFHHPATASDGTGQFLVVYEREVNSSNRNIQAIRVTAATGQPQGNTINIRNQPETSETSPDVAPAANEAYLVVWQESDDGHVWVRRLNDNDSLTTSQAMNGSTEGQRTRPAVVANSSQALAVWQDTGPGGSGQTLVTGRRLSLAGTTSGDESFISPYYSRREWSAVTAHAPSQTFLLTWQQALSSPNPDILVQRLDAQGQALAAPLNLTLHSAAQQHPAVEAGQTGSLVIWEDSRNSGSSGVDIYGQLLDSSGNLSGTLLSLSTATGDQVNPAIAYNSSRNEYLVIWNDNRNDNWDLYGQIVQPDGSLGGTVSLQVVSRQTFSDLAYNPADDTYLLVWEEGRNNATLNSDIYGRVISASGSAIGSDFAVASVTADQFDPVVAYGVNSGRYLVSWWDQRSGNWDIYGQVISGSGVLSGSNFAISTPSGTNNDQAYPAIVSGPSGGSDEFLIVWHDRRSSMNRDIYGQRVDTSGQLLDEPDTVADETSPMVNIPFDTGSDYTEYPSVAYRAG